MGFGESHSPLMKFGPISDGLAETPFQDTGGLTSCTPPKRANLIHVRRSGTMNLIQVNRCAQAAVMLILILSSVPEGVAGEARPRIPRRKIVAEVVALDQPYFYNRLGAVASDGLIYALRRDVVSDDGPNAPLVPGKVHLRKDKRPRPLVLRMNVGDVLEVTFANLLENPFVPPDPKNPFASAPTRYVGLSVFGLELVDEKGKPLSGKEHSGSFVGANPTSIAAPQNVPSAPKPGETRIYRFYAPAEGTFLMTSYADTTGTQSASGLFGAVNVQPEGAEYYRSQVTHEDLVAATVRAVTRPAGGYAIPGEQFTELTGPQSDDEKLLQGKPAAKIEAAQPAYTRRAGGPRMLTMTRVDPSRRTSNTANVSRTDDGRLLGETGQPLINYRATDKAGLPILSMLQAAIGDAPTFTIGAGKVPDAPRDLAAGIISTALRLEFETNHAALSDQAGVTKASATDQDRGAWLITDVNGKAYVIKQLESQPDALQVYSATFKLVHGDLTAVITGPDAGRFSTTNASPTFRENPSLPDRRQPYREYTILYHRCRRAPRRPSRNSRQRLPAATAPDPPAARKGRIRHQLWDRRDRGRGAGESARRRPDGPRGRGRPEVRGVFPERLGGRRPGDGRGSAGELQPKSQAHRRQAARRTGRRESHHPGPRSEGSRPEDQPVDKATRSVRRAARGRDASGQRAIASARPEHLPRRPVQRLPQLHARPRQVPHPPRGGTAGRPLARPSPPRPPVAALAQ